MGLNKTQNRKNTLMVVVEWNMVKDVSSAVIVRTTPFAGKKNQLPGTFRHDIFEEKLRQCPVWSTMERCPNAFFNDAIIAFDRRDMFLCASVIWLETVCITHAFQCRFNLLIRLNEFYFEACPRVKSQYRQELFSVVSHRPVGVVAKQATAVSIAHQNKR
jgi:hypothetical protein